MNREAILFHLGEPKKSLTKPLKILKAIQSTIPVSFESQRVTFTTTLILLGTEERPLPSDIKSPLRLILMRGGSLLQTKTFFWGE
jgi:hypothetical protein